VPQTFTQLHYHLVFSTRHREPMLTPQIRERVWDYLGGIIRSEGGISIRVGGTADHVHLLATLHQNQSLAVFMRKLKANSSGWAHETFPESRVWWQTGYGAFTVSHSAVDAVRNYIENQEQHHREMSFQDEFRGLLKRHGIQYDERYLWD
jgi:putative transposase